MLYRILACVIATLAHLPAYADAYPTRPIRFINPTAPGGTAEPIARVIALKLSETLGQSVVVDSRGGAGGTVATATAANAPPRRIHDIAGCRVADGDQRVAVRRQAAL